MDGKSDVFEENSSKTDGKVQITSFCQVHRKPALIPVSLSAGYRVLNP